MTSLIWPILALAALVALYAVEKDQEGEDE